MTEDTRLPAHSLQLDVDGSRRGARLTKTAAPRRYSNAVVWLDGQAATFIKFEGSQIAPHRYRVEAYRAARDMDGSVATSELFDDLCNAMRGVHSVLVTGPEDAIERFENYVAAHRPDRAAHLAGHQALAAPDETRMVALAQWHLTPPDRCVRRSPPAPRQSLAPEPGGSPPPSESLS